MEKTKNDYPVSLEKEMIRVKAEQKDFIFFSGERKNN